MESVRIGAVRYLNTAPLIEGLDQVQGLTLIPAVPSRLAPMLEAGQVDVALASIVDLVGGRVPLTVLPVGMIGCDGPTLTVRVFSEVPLSEVTEVCADTDSHTSVILCRLLFRRRFGRDVVIVPFDARERVVVSEGGVRSGHPSTVLLIGDKVVTDPTPAVRYPHQLDLGEAWKQETGLPFVYAAWACRAEDAEKPEIRMAAELLDRQRRHNRTRLDWIASTRAPGARWPADLAGKYLGTLLRYELGAREREAAERFLGMAREAGMLPHERAIAWARPLGG